jgi:glycosyltransferase involved in cell wall biosynthesis
MNILSIGYTQSLHNSSLDNDETIIRILEYGKYLNEYYIVTYSNKNRNLKKHVELADNIHCYTHPGGNRILSYLFLFHRCVDILIHHKITLIQAQDPLRTGSIAFILGKLFNIPINICVYGSNPYDLYYSKDTALVYLTGWLSKYILKNCEGIQTDGQKIISSLINNGINKEKIFYKPLIPENIEIFRNSNKVVFNRRASNNEKTIKLLTVGRLVSQKNFSMLFIVCKMLLYNKIPFSLKIIGEGPEKKRLLKQCVKDNLTDYVQFMGNIPYSNLPKFFAECDIFLLTSKFEGFPRVLMAAAESSLPIITTNVGGAVDLIEHGKSGFISEINDTNSYFNYVKILYENPQLRDVFGKLVFQNFQIFKTKFRDLRIQKEIWKNLNKVL